MLHWFWWAILFEMPVWTCPCIHEIDGFQLRGWIWTCGGSPNDSFVNLNPPGPPQKKQTYYRQKKPLLLCGIQLAVLFKHTFAKPKSDTSSLPKATMYNIQCTMPDLNQPIHLVYVNNWNQCLRTQSCCNKSKLWSWRPCGFDMGWKPWLKSHLFTVASSAAGIRCT